MHLKSAGVEGQFSHPLASVRDIGRACGSASSLGGIAVPFNLCVSMVVGIMCSSTNQHVVQLEILSESAKEQETC